MYRVVRLAGLALGTEGSSASPQSSRPGRPGPCADVQAGSRLSAASGLDSLKSCLFSCSGRNQKGRAARRGQVTWNPHCDTLRALSSVSLRISLYTHVHIHMSTYARTHTCLHPCATCMLCTYMSMLPQSGLSLGQVVTSQVGLSQSHENEWRCSLPTPPSGQQGSSQMTGM